MSSSPAKAALYNSSHRWVSRWALNIAIEETPPPLWPCARHLPGSPLVSWEIFVFFELESPALGAALQLCPPQGTAEGMTGGSPPSPGWTHCAMQPSTQLASLATRANCWFMGSCCWPPGPPGVGLPFPNFLSYLQGLGFPRGSLRSKDKSKDIH